MAKAVHLLGIRVNGPDSEFCPTDVADINIACPKCSQQHASKRLTMNINFDNNVFGCPRCNFNGGVYRLIGFYTNWPTKEVEARIRAGELNNFKPSDEISKLDISNEGRPKVEQAPLAPLQQRDEVYRALMKLLTLCDEHRKDLLRRGLRPETIDRIGFRTYPKFLPTTVIPQKLINRGLDLRGVPGFGINEAGEWSLAKLPDSGFLIPNLTGTGLIQGYQIRFDHPGANIPKYGYLTSKGMRFGTKCETWCCWSGEDVSKKEKAEPFDVILIEGPLKAFIVHDLTGCNVISVPGVNALKKIPAALQSFQPFGLRSVKIAYDMDSETNENVHSQLMRLREILDDIGIPHQTMKWDSRFKGLDDWLSAKKEGII